MNEKEFAFILDKGEDFKIEFRENVPGMEKDIVAFANAEGGTILLGVDDKKKIKGLALTNKIKSEIQDIARNCDPAISIDVSSFDNVLIVTVPESINKPHRCSSGFYLRQGASSQKLTVAEIRELFSKQGKLLFEEMINKEFSMTDFDKKKFEVYLKKANISKVLPEKNLLRNMGILTEKEQFKNAGILMFAKEPAMFI